MHISLITATKETAFLHAISSAAITHEITLQCARNKIPGCRCGKTKSRKRGNADWQWGGCSDNIKYGEKETRRFIDKSSFTMLAGSRFNNLFFIYGNCALNRPALSKLLTYF